MIRTRRTAVIPARPSEIYALLTDPARLVKLSRHPVEVVTAGELPDGRRTSHTRTRLPSGATVDARNVVVEAMTNRRIVVVSEVRPYGFAPTRRGRFGRLVTRLERTLEPHPAGTLVTAQAEFRITPVPLRWYFAVVKRDQWQRALDEGLALLRAAF